MIQKCRLLFEARLKLKLKIKSLFSKIQKTLISKNYYIYDAFSFLQIFIAY